MLIIGNRVKVSAVGTDVGVNFILGEPIPGFSGFKNGDVTYTALSDTGVWQIAEGTVASGQLFRGNILENSDGTLNQIDFTGCSLQIAQTSSVEFFNEITGKLDTIEEYATADMESSEVKVSYESNEDTNAYTDYDKSKLSSSEVGATADQTATEIKTEYESNEDTNGFTDAEKAKLLTVSEYASALPTAEQTKTSYESNEDTNVFDDSAKAKLSGIAVDATADQIASEVPFTTTTDIISTNTNSAIEELNSRVKDHTQGADSVIYDSTNDPITGSTDIQSTLLDHSSAIDNRVASLSGIISGGKLTASLGASVFTIEAGTGVVFDSYSDPTVSASIPFSWAEDTNVPVSPEIADLLVATIKVFVRTSYGVTYVYKVVGDVPLSTYRDNVFLGTVYVVNGVITDILSTPSVIKQTATDVYDLMVVDPVLHGGLIFPVPSTLSLWQQAGTIFYPGISWHDQDHKNPNTFYFGSSSEEPRQPVPILLLDSSGGIQGTGVTVVPKTYENSGVITALTGTQATVHKVYSIGLNGNNKQYVLSYGQYMYVDAEEAKDYYLSNDSYVQPSETENMSFLGYVCVSAKAIDFSDGSLSWIISGSYGQLTSSSKKSIYHETLLDRDTVDQHTIPSITGLNTELDSKMVWEGNYTPKMYNYNDVVKDDKWLMIANKATDDRPSPNLIGSPNYLYDGDLTLNFMDAKVVLYGMKYIWEPAINSYITGYRIYGYAGQKYNTSYTINSINVSLDTIECIIDGWIEIPLGSVIISFGAEIEIFCEVISTNYVGTSWNSNYNWETPNSTQEPSIGSIVQCRDNPSVLRVSNTDIDGTDNSTAILNLTVGDKIITEDVEYNIVLVVPEVGYTDFTVSPHNTSTDGVVNVVFDTTEVSNIKYGVDVEYNINNSKIYGIASSDGSYEDNTYNSNQYGVDILTQNAVLSEDWDILSLSKV